jgi:hypothetical protein
MVHDWSMVRMVVCEMISRRNPITIININIPITVLYLLYCSLEKRLQLLQNAWLPAWLPNGKDLIQKFADSFAHDSRLP